MTAEEIPLDDKETFRLFSEAKTTGVFQFESDGMKKYLKELHPESVEDLCFMAAAYRPRITSYNVCYTKLLRFIVFAMFLAIFRMNEVPF